MVDKYSGEVIAFVTGSKIGMIVGIIIAIIIVIVILVCIRQAYKGLKEAKERALTKLGALIKREENVELPDAAPDMELSAVQPASTDKKKLVRNMIATGLFKSEFLGPTFVATNIRTCVEPEKLLIFSLIVKA